MTAWVIIFICAVSLMILPIIEGFLLKLTAKDRDRMLELASSMMGSPDYPDEQKAQISDMLDTALDRKFMVRVVLCLPVIFLRLLHGKIESPTIVVDDKFREFVQLHWKSVSAANPTFALIFRLQLILIFAFCGFAASAITIAVLIQKVADKESKEFRNSSNNLHSV